MMAYLEKIPAWIWTRKGAVAAVAALQLVALGYMVMDRVWLVKTGREIVLPIAPVDPRDLFKGDFVRLAYPISRLENVEISEPKPHDRAWAYAVIEPLPVKEDGWRVVRIDAQMPRDLKPEQVVLKAKTTSSWSDRRQTLRYGLERYYVPEGTGLELERIAAQRKMAAIVAVDRSGNAAIKGLAIDGKKVYDEPMF